MTIHHESREVHPMLRRTFTAAAAAVLAAGVATAGTAHAAPLECGIRQVGDPENYNVNYGGFHGVAGTIAQVYDACGTIGPAGYTYAQWTWKPAFQQQFPTATVLLGLGSMGLHDGQALWMTTYTAGSSPTTVFAGKDHASANPDSWRAGAELDYSGCAAWTSQHYYANGTETAGPYAGCNDVTNISSIPWTQP
jgi:hypothetical protein